MWPLLAAGATLKLGSSWLGGRSAKKAAARAEELARQRAAQIQQYGRDAQGRLQTVADQMPGADSFRAWNIRTGMGGWDIDPTTGQATSYLSPRAQQAQDWYYNQADNAREQLGNFDRQGFAQQEFNRGQGLLKEARDSGLSNLLGMLQRKGLSGFGQTPVGGTSTTASNPLLNSYFDRMNRQDLELMDRSYGAADTQMDRIERRANGMFDRGYGMNDDLNSQLELGMRYGEADYRRGMDSWKTRWDMATGMEPYYKTAALGGMEDIGAAQNMGIQARLSRDQGFANTFGDIGSSLMGQGMFGQGGMFPKPMPQTSMSNDQLWRQINGWS